MGQCSIEEQSKGGLLCSLVLITVQTGKIKYINTWRTKLCKEFTFDILTSVDEYSQLSLEKMPV